MERSRPKGLNFFGIGMSALRSAQRVVLILVQPTDTSSHVRPRAYCVALKKRHGNHDRLLNYTHGTCAWIRDYPERFTELGVQVFELRNLDSMPA